MNGTERLMPKQWYRPVTLKVTSQGAAKEGLPNEGTLKLFHDLTGVSSLVINLNKKLPHYGQVITAILTDIIEVIGAKPELRGKIDEVVISKHHVSPFTRGSSYSHPDRALMNLGELENWVYVARPRLDALEERAHEETLAINPLVSYAAGTKSVTIDLTYQEYHTKGAPLGEKIKASLLKSL